MIERCGALLLDLDTPETRKLVEKNPYYAFTTVTRGVYPQLLQDRTTLAVMATLVTSAETPENVVYELTRAVFEQLFDLKRMHPAFAGLNPAGMVHDGISVPLHRGARRYYKERGWITDEKS